MDVLDLGCGRRKRAEAIGVDVARDTDADVIHDLNTFPYPFADDQFDRVYCDNIIEHLDNIVRVLEELHRITKDGAAIEIIVPFFRSVFAYIDPTHKHFFTVRSFDYFDPDKDFTKYYRYSKCRFKVEKVILDKEIPHKTVGKIIKWIANRKPLYYELKLSGIYPLNTLTYYLRTVKDCTTSEPSDCAAERSES